MGVLDEAQKYLLEQEKDAVEGVLTVNGFNFAGPGQNSGFLFIKLRDWDERKKSSLSVSAVLGRANKYFAGIKDANVFAVQPPAVLELGNTAGFDLMLQNRGGLDRAQFLAARNQLLGAAAQDPRLAGVRPNGVEDAPQFKLDIDREKASALGISVADINSTLQTGWASTYVNDFIDRGRVKRVYVQGDPGSRMQPDDLNRWYVRNKDGGMVPFSAFGRGEWTYGPQKLLRFNGVPAYQIQGGPAPGRSSGEAMQAMEELVAKLPAGVGLEWTGLSYEERRPDRRRRSCMRCLSRSCSCASRRCTRAGRSRRPCCRSCRSAYSAPSLRRWRADSPMTRFQVGLLVTIGLAAKSAILIVEFAKENFDHGMDIVESVMHAAKQRVRPIFMTSLAFMAGVLPLALSSGAGSGAQHAVGTGVIGGMLASTFLAVFFVPVFFVVILRYFKVKPVTMKVDETPADAVCRCHMSARPKVRGIFRGSVFIAMMALGAARWRRAMNSRLRPYSRNTAHRCGPRAAVPVAQLQGNRLEGILPRSRNCRHCWHVRWSTTAICASPRSMSRGSRVRSTAASSAPSSCRPSTRRVRHDHARVPANLSQTGRAVSRTYSAGFGVSAFELDLFGRVRSLRRAALEDYFRLEETRTAAQLVLVSEVANAWLTLIADRQLLKLARETHDSQRKSYDLTKLRFDSGVSSEIDLHRSETSWREAEIDIAQQTRRVAQDRNALALLVGEPLPPEVADGAGPSRRRLLRKLCPPAFRRNCWCGGPTCGRPSTR